MSLPMYRFPTHLWESLEVFRNVSGCLSKSYISPYHLWESLEVFRNVSGCLSKCYISPYLSGILTFSIGFFIP
jgi:hypothetical protein